MLFVLALGLLGLIGCTPENTPECTEDQLLIDNVCIDDESDTVAPTITGIQNINYTIDDDTPNYLDGITATDDIDGDLTDDITIDTSAVDLTTEGEYTVTLTVSDSSGNVVTESFTVFVVEGVPDYAALAAIDIAALSFPDTIDVPDEILILDLPSTTRNGSRFTWTTSHPEIIAPSGFVANPVIGSDPVTVTLTATLKNGTHEENLSYDITVQPYQEVQVTSSDTISFTNLSNQYFPDDQDDVAIHFVDEGAVPYIDIETYINMLDGVFDADAITVTAIDTDVLEVRYHPVLMNYYLFYPEPESIPQNIKTLFDQSAVEPDVEDVTAVFDFTTNTVTFSSYLFFTKLVTMKNPVESLGIHVVDVEAEYGDPITIPMNDYNVDILIFNDGTSDQYLVPYHLIEMMFTSASWYSTFYKPEGLYGQEVSWNVSALPLVTSAQNGEDIPYDIRTASYNLFMMSLDYFTSRKGYDEIDSYLTHFANKKELIITSSKANYYTVYANVLREIDDLKAIATSRGYFDSSPGSSINPTTPYGPRVAALNTAYGNLYSQMSSKYGSLNIPSNYPTLRLLDDDKTAVIHFYEFNRDVPDEFKERLDLLPATIENVVIDVSLNIGGNVGAVFRMFGYMTDNITRFHVVNPISNARMTYYVSNDLPTYDYNWYMMISGASFNAGSVVAGAVMENELATVIGQRGYGSTSPADVISLPCGLIYTLLSHSSFYGRTGNEIDGYEYAPLQYGVDVEYQMTNILDDQEIIDTINQHLTDIQD